MDDSKDRAEQPQQRRDHPDIGEINDAIVQTGCDPRSFRLGDLAHLLKIRVRIFGREIENLLHNPRDRFAMTIRDREQARDNRVCAKARRPWP